MCDVHVIVRNAYPLERETSTSTSGVHLLLFAYGPQEIKSFVAPMKSKQIHRPAITAIGVSAIVYSKQSGMALDGN